MFKFKLFQESVMEKEEEKTEKMSRRDFLKKGVSAAGVAASAGTIGSMVAIGTKADADATIGEHGENLEQSEEIGDFEVKFDESLDVNEEPTEDELNKIMEEILDPGFLDEEPESPKKKKNNPKQLNLFT